MTDRGRKIKRVCDKKNRPGVSQDGFQAISKHLKDVAASTAVAAPEW
ncbi:MAG TPA: hypothetical protein VFH49_15500 [Aquabacterium sp.]|nr:hypothetical protein [Aquabacterium sp.]